MNLRSSTIDTSARSSATLKYQEGRDLFTTGYWYVRLCQAVLGGRTPSGVLSGPSPVFQRTFNHERPLRSCSSPVPSVSSAFASWLR